MEFLTSTAIYVLPFLFIITVLVYVHEMGHYLVAKKCGVGVEVFSIGFGPELFGWTNKEGERWKICIIPLGGYVKFFGDADATSVLPDKEKMAAMSDVAKKKSLLQKNPWQRIAISAAGPAANYLFAIVVLAGVFATYGQRFMEPVIHSVVEGGAAKEAGLLGGDRITSINGQSIATFSDVQFEVQESSGIPLQVNVERANENLNFTVTPKSKEMIDRFGNKQNIGMLGIEVRATGYKKRGPIESLYYAVNETYSITAKTLRSVGQMIVGKRSGDGLVGMVGVAQISGMAIQVGLAEFLWLACMISIGLGLINLFPIPMLDGGHIVFYAIEIIRGKPLSENAQEWAFRIGFSVVVFLMVFALWNDFSRLGVVRWIQALFS